MKSNYLLAAAVILVVGQTDFAFGAGQDSREAKPVLGVPTNWKPDKPVVGVPPVKKPPVVVGVPPVKKPPVVGVPTNWKPDKPVVGVPTNWKPDKPVVGIRTNWKPNSIDGTQFSDGLPDANSAPNITIGDKKKGARVTGFDLPTELQPGYAAPTGGGDTNGIVIQAPTVQTGQEVRGAQ